MVMSNNFKRMPVDNNSIILSAALIYLLGLIISISELLLGLIQGLLVFVIIILSIISLILTDNLIMKKTMTGTSKLGAFFKRVEFGANPQNAFVETQPIVAG